MTALASDQFALLKMMDVAALTGAATIDNSAIAKIKNAIGTTSRFAHNARDVTRLQDCAAIMGPSRRIAAANLKADRPGEQLRQPLRTTVGIQPRRTGWCPNREAKMPLRPGCS